MTYYASPRWEDDTQDSPMDLVSFWLICFKRFLHFNFAFNLSYKFLKKYGVQFDNGFPLMANFFDTLHQSNFLFVSCAPMSTLITIIVITLTTQLLTFQSWSLPWALIILQNQRLFFCFNMLNLPSCSS